jgi:heat shock protein HslJ
MKRFNGSTALLTFVVAAACLIAALAVAGCSSGDGSGDGGGGDDVMLLEAADWQATEIAGQAALAGAGAGADAADVTAAFAAGELSGSGGVNRYTATYEATADGAITVSTPAATLMAGPPAAMEQEQAYFAALEQVAGFSATADSLTLTDEQGNVLVRYEARQPTALQGTTWEALAYNNGKQALVSLEASSSITAVFGDDGSLTGDASVNRSTTGYTTSGETMSIDAAIATTRMAGPDELMRQEAAYLAALPRTATYSMEGDDLWLRDEGGAALAHYVAAPD